MTQTVVLSWSTNFHSYLKTLLLTLSTVNGLAHLQTFEQTAGLAYFEISHLTVDEI